MPVTKSSSASKDRVEGKREQLTGKGKKIAGKVTGNKRMAGEGRVEEIKGKARDTIGRARDRTQGSR